MQAMNNYSAKSVCVVDNGQFVELAVRLARDFGTAYYFNPWVSAFPRMSDAAVGEGIPEIQLLYSLWDHLDKIDLWVFPDIYFADIQHFLRAQGRRVWGAAGAEWLELDRWSTHNRQLELGIGTPITERIVGIDLLRRRLAEVEDKWVKVAVFRGDFETYHHLRYFTSEPWLNDIQNKFGPLAREVEFLVQESVPGVEIAYDGWTIDGRFPDRSLFGYEVKDLGYVGHVKPYTELPQQIREVNAAFSDLLHEERCRSFLAFEMRVAEDGIPIVIDPCMRCGSPPTEANMELWSNLAEVLWEGAAGNLVQPTSIADYAVMALIHSPYAIAHWMAVDFPPEFRQWIKFRYLTVLNGRHYFVPQDVPMAEIGAVVGLGNTLEEAIAHVDMIAPGVQGYQIEVHNAVFDKAREAIEEGEAYGIEF